MSAATTPEESINGQAFELVDKEVMSALLGQSKSNLLIQKFNAWTGGMAHVSDVIEALLSAEQSHESNVALGSLSTAGAGDGPCPQAYNFDGRCPLKDADARKAAAEVAGGILMKAVAVQNEFRVWAWRAGEARPINTALDASLVRRGPLSGLPLTPTWEDLLNVLGMFVLLPSLALTDGGNRTTWFNNAAHMSCWEPSPLFAGPMIFKYSSVYPRLTDPNQKRGFYTATAPQSTSFFSKDSPLFLDGERHHVVRSLLDQAGFARRYDLDQVLVQAVPAVTGPSVDAITVTRAVLPSLMKAVWGEEPPANIKTAMEEYGKYGKYAIFGKVIEDYALGPIGVAAKISEARKSVAQWATSTPFFQVLEAARDIHFHGHPWLLDSGAFAANLVDASLFAGLVGTTDLVHKCVNYQLRDTKHKKLFEDDPEKYLIELMRYDSAVTSVTEVLDRNMTLVIAGRNITFAPGTPVQLVLAAANRDPVHFQLPDDFNPMRQDLGETLAWNGAVRDVEARDFQKAPRHCPGYCLSLKVGAAVCAQMVGSYDRLSALKKVGGGKVLCTNFDTRQQEIAWQPPSTWQRLPFYDYSSPGHAPIMRLLKSGVECKSADFYIGTFSNVMNCANAVMAAGGKFFIFGTGSIKNGWCYREWTHTGHCPEGWESDSYDFYDLPGIAADEVLQCEIDVVPTTIAQSSGLLTSKDIRDEDVTLAEARGKVTGLFWRKYSCAWEHKMSCKAGPAEIKTYEACCSLGWWGSACAIPAEKTETATKTLSSRGQQWKQCKEKDLTAFKADPPSDPRLPQAGLEDGACLSVGVGAKTHTLRAKFNSCPSWLNLALSAFAQANKQSYDFYSQYIPSSARDHPIAVLFGKSPESSLLDPAVFDTYTIGMTVAVVHLQLKSFEGRLKNASELIALPHRQDFLDRVFVNDFRGSAEPEIDAPKNNAIDSAVEFGQLCIMDTFREMALKDDVLGGTNVWSSLLGEDLSSPSHCPKGQVRCTKKEFILGVFADYVTKDGDSTYPSQQIDFRGSFYKHDLWEDAAEKLLAFEHLAMHRTRALAPSEAPALDGVSAPFVVSSSGLGALQVRAGFGRLGADMFFSSAGDPVMVRTPDGHDIWRSKAPTPTWQYWKFVWRSSMFLLVTLVDHLWTTHYSASNALAAASREGLPPTHPLRRLLTMSTFGSINVNSRALHQLIGPDHLLHRSTPFQDFHEIAKVAHASIPSMKDAYGAFVDDSIFQALDPTLQKMPFYQDGRLIFKTLASLVDKWADLHSNEWCGVDGNIKDASIKLFMKRVNTWSLFDRTAVSDNAWLGLYSASNEIVCKGFYTWLKTMLFAVSGYHRQVGTVADIASDPDFASFSNVVGESFGRPRQHLQMALIAGSTAQIMPKVTSDYRFLATGLPREAEAAKILNEFQADMLANAREVDVRNGQRSTPYLQMHPMFVESSVAV